MPYSIDSPEYKEAAAKLAKSVGDDVLKGTTRLWHVKVSQYTKTDGGGYVCKWREYIAQGEDARDAVKDIPLLKGECIDKVYQCRGRVYLIGGGEEKVLDKAV